MKTIQILIFSSILLFLYSCSSVRVSSEYVKNTDFQQFSTYKIITPDNLPAKVTSTNKTQIEEAIQRELSMQNFKEKSGNSDLSVSYFVLVDTHQDVDSYINYYGNRRWGHAVVTNEIREYKEGVLIIDLVYNKNQEVVWHAVASSTLDKDPSSTKKEINEAVKAVFDKYAKQTNLAKG